MVDLKAVDNSKKKYEEAKAYFASQNLSDCVIEISEKPMNEWVVHYTKTEEEMSDKRISLIVQIKPFITIYHDTDGVHFFYTDHQISIEENLTKNDVVLYDIEDSEKFDLEEIKKEYLALKKFLQGA